MKKEIIVCDLCEKEIEPVDGKPFVLKPGKNPTKKIGHDMVLTPRGNRMYTHSGKAMFRINAAFYCGVYPDNVEEFHFHTYCIEQEILTRLSNFLFQNPPLIKEGLTDDH